ncbi:MAG: DUF1460 domain-containing protein [Brevinematales bacterium]|nr:DUF1460 domain-containing protein [Brevinematales bacterium]
MVRKVDWFVIFTLSYFLFLSTISHSLELGDKIVYYAKRFLGTPYDIDPLGTYVKEKKIVVDDKVDCMYLTFRVVELALADGDESNAIQIALDKRFKTRGVLQNGYVLNYEDRFEYGEDMILSGKWGKVIKVHSSMLEKVYSGRLEDYIYFIPKSNYSSIRRFIRNGSIVFLVKHPETSVKGEIVGHLGIIEKSSNQIYIIHASGTKNRGGRVKREIFEDYLRKTKYIGFILTHLD